MFKLSNNTTLPTANALGVKSFWLLLVTVLVTACNAFGFDLVGSLCEVGLGCTADEVASKGNRAVSLIQQLIPIISAVWLWLERRAPNFRLTLWKSRSSAFAFFAVALLALGTIAGGASPARAVTCMPVASADSMLRESYGEAPVAGGRSGTDVSILLYTSGDITSWTLLAVHGEQACLIATGHNWLPPLPGRPS